MTFLFQDIIIGPIHSRRFGHSLGINLLPISKKVCNYDCVYCECGKLTEDSEFQFCNAEVVNAELESRIKYLLECKQIPDVFTFAGNGEPTLHPEFSAIIDNTIKLRNRYLPQTKIVVLSNATTVHKPAIRDALCKIDIAMLKLDAGNERAIRIVNQPTYKFNFKKLLENLISFREKLIIQTLFFSGQIEGKYFSNTSPEELSDWFSVIQKINPQKVVIYTIARDTPIPLEPVEQKVLQEIGDTLSNMGIPTETTY